MNKIIKFPNEKELDKKLREKIEREVEAEDLEYVRLETMEYLRRNKDKIKNILIISESDTGEEIELFSGSDEWLDKKLE